jgi:hypothetical protein
MNLDPSLHFDADLYPTFHVIENLGSVF